MKTITTLLTCFIITFAFATRVNQKITPTISPENPEKLKSSGLNGFSVPISSDFASSEDARLMVNEAISYIEQEGLETALKEFNNQRGKFIYKDLYIFVIDRKGNMLAHGQNQKMIGKNHFNLKDIKGKFMIQDIINKSMKYSSGWSDYKWKSSKSKKIESKTTYYKVIDNKYIVCCGAYRYKNM